MNEKSSKLKKIFIGLIVVGVLAALIAVPVTQHINTKKTYEYAETLIASENYKGAIAELEKISKSNYNDTTALISLCQAHIDFADGSAYSAYMTINDVKFDHQTPEQIEKIETFKQEVEVAYNEYLEIQAKERAEYEKQQRASYASRLPFEGMDEKYINDTIIGRCDESSREKNSKYTKYIWRSSNGKDIPLIVSCKDGQVVSVTKYYTDTYWTKDGKPNFSAYRSTKSSSSSKKKTYHDTYDDGYEDVYNDGDYDWDRYDEDEDYARGVDDALDDWDEYGEDW